MNWDAIGAIAESIGAIAVILTLAFLAIQIRHGARVIDKQNDLAESDAHARGVEVMSNFRYQLASDHELAIIWRKGQRNEELTESEVVRFRHLTMAWFEAMSVVYFNNLKSGREDAAEKVVVAQARNLKANAGLRSIWEENRFLLDPGMTGLGQKIEALMDSEEEGKP